MNVQSLFPGIDPPELLTIRQLAESSGISKPTIYAAVSSGRIISQRYGGRILLDAQSAEQYVRMHNRLKEN